MYFEPCLFAAKNISKRKLISRVKPDEQEDKQLHIGLSVDQTSTDYQRFLIPEMCKWQIKYSLEEHITRPLGAIQLATWYFSLVKMLVAHLLVLIKKIENSLSVFVL